MNCYNKIYFNLHPYTQAFIRHPRYMFVYRMFISFLAKNHALHSFLYNSREEHADVKKLEERLFTRSGVLCITSIYALFSIAFSWALSPQKFSYWSELNNKWCGLWNNFSKISQ